MFVIGLTGGIATGKSTVSNFFAYHGVPVVNADNITHCLLRQASVIKQISEFAPEAVEAGHVNRAKLGEIVFNNNALLNTLETLLHPLIRLSEFVVIDKMQRLGKNTILLDIPLLYEARDISDFDMVITTTCPLRMQKHRALSRKNMTQSKLAAILQRQIPTHDKELMADAIISTGLNKAHTMRQVKHIMSTI